MRNSSHLSYIYEQEEHRILDKTNRQKVLEVEKLSETIKELEEAILAAGATANAVRDYQRQISELQVILNYYTSLLVYVCVCVL